MNLEANEDFVDIAQCLLDAKCEFVIVGAYALAANGVVRATSDLDVLVRPSRANAVRVIEALRAFGAPLSTHGVTAADFAKPGNVYQMGLPPRRIDILTSISGVTYAAAAANAVVGRLSELEVPCIGRAALIRNKRAASRPKDLADVDALTALRTESNRTTSHDRGKSRRKPR